MATVLADIDDHHRTPGSRRPQAGEGDRPQEVLKTLDLTDEAYGGIPGLGSLPPLFQRRPFSGRRVADIVASFLASG